MIRSAIPMAQDTLVQHVVASGNTAVVVVAAEPWQGGLDGYVSTVINTVGGSALAAGESVQVDVDHVNPDGTVTALASTTYGAGTASGSQPAVALAGLAALLGPIPDSLIRVTMTYVAGGGPVGLEAMSAIATIRGGARPQGGFYPFG